jgi:hypothetical protein
MSSVFLSILVNMFSIAVKKAMGTMLLEIVGRFSDENQHLMEDTDHRRSSHPPSVCRLSRGILGRF